MSSSLLVKEIGFFKKILKPFTQKHMYCLQIQRVSLSKLSGKIYHHLTEIISENGREENKSQFILCDQHNLKTKPDKTL